MIVRINRIKFINSKVRYIIDAEFAHIPIILHVYGNRCKAFNNSVNGKILPASVLNNLSQMGKRSDFHRFFFIRIFF